MKKFRITFNSPVILGFVLICILVMTVDQMTQGRFIDMFFITYHSSLQSPMTYLRFITHVFGHVGWNHLISNIIYILLLGPMIEEKYGSWKVVQVILATAVVTGVINYLFFENLALCGASGVCFAFILMSSLTQFKEKEIPLTFIFVAAVFLGGQIYDGLMLQDNISNMAHIFGGVIGAFIGFHSNKKYR